MQKKLRRQRLGLLRPITCPRCTVKTSQRRVGALDQRDMLRKALEHLVVARRQCLTCFHVFCDIESHDPNRRLKRGA